MEITKEQFEQGRLRAFGTTNPERMPVPFWEFGVSQIRVVVEGDLPEELCLRIAEEARANAEAAIGCACRLAE